jgi:hypothetical protein
LVAATPRGRWVDYRLDGEDFSRLWVPLTKAGVPLPSEAVTTGPARPGLRDRGQHDQHGHPDQAPGRLPSQRKGVS